MPVVTRSQTAHVSKIADSLNMHILHALADGHDAEVIDLIRSGVNPNSFVGTSSTVWIFWAARYGRYRVVEELLKHGALVNVTDYQGFTPLHEAVRESRDEIVELLLRHRAYPNAKTFRFHQTPLFFATNAKTAAILLKHGADVHAIDVFGKTAEILGLINK